MRLGTGSMSRAQRVVAGVGLALALSLGTAVMAPGAGADGAGSPSAVWTSQGLDAGVSNLLGGISCPDSSCTAVGQGWSAVESSNGSF